MKLYTHPWSNHAARVQILLNELAIKGEIYEVELMEENLNEDFLVLNPNGKVPILQDGSVVLWESHAIMRYLCDKYADGRLYSNGSNRYRVEQWLDWNHTRLNIEAVTINFNNVVLGKNADLTAIEHAQEQALILLEILDSALKINPFVAEQYSIADISLFTTVLYLQKKQYRF
ncbi:glutathione S-transferase family protein [Pseudoalteromonas sp. S16_S37]|uniref:glutathione S-transferase family protein n=1 Tax=Pseudoalteromonas sp. S16_S37 TaxID=2720228 RepID=UPI00167FEECF|nr:glutathione S-transferase family protein [Pseudoalteromonas sp. S16_S37]MBD1584428.1 glutathione S-transferase family protein [Pseudoalteromonas sp. S16_S37]